MKPVLIHRVALAVVLLVAASATAQNKRENRVREDRREVEARGDWHYNDLEAAAAEAKKTGRPLLVVFRCIP